MMHIICLKQYKPRYYNPYGGFTITSYHISRFLGCHMGKMLSGLPSVEDTWFTRESLDAVGAVKEIFIQDAFRDIYRCMNFSDDWDEEEDDNDNVEWDEVYNDAKFEPPPDVARHRRKSDHIEDGFNKWWKE